MKKICFVMIICLQSFAFSTEGIFGYFVPHRELVKNYKMSIYDDMGKVFIESAEEYILTVNNDIALIDARVIAEKVYKVSQCFEIDPKVFLGLMRLESLFNIQAVSPTGAVGITQFTTIGAQEVSDQLGRRGSSYANKKNTIYLREKLLNCVNSNWLDLWERVNSDDWQIQKEIFLSEVESPVVYGAILLKVYLAKAKRNEDLREVYYDALKNYNGEPGQRKFWYAKKVLEYFDEMKF